MRFLEQPSVRLVIAGAAAGLVVLGVGGRLAMAGIQMVVNDAPSRWSLGGTMTVVWLGAASGLGGALVAMYAALMVWLDHRWSAAHPAPAA